MPREKSWTGMVEQLDRKFILQFKYPHWKQANKEGMSEYVCAQEFLKAFWLERWMGQTCLFPVRFVCRYSEFRWFPWLRNQAGKERGESCCSGNYSSAAMDIWEIPRRNLSLRESLFLLLHDSSTCLKSWLITDAPICLSGFIEACCFSTTGFAPVISPGYFSLYCVYSWSAFFVE